MDKTIPINDVAHACAAVWCFAHAPHFLPNLANRYGVKVEHGAEGLAVLYIDAQDPHSRIRRDVDTHLRNRAPTSDRLREAVDERAKSMGVSIAPEKRELLMNLTTLLVVGAELKLDREDAQLASHVVGAARAMSGVVAPMSQSRTDEIARQTDHAKRVLTPTDLPPPMDEDDDQVAANDSQGSFIDDMPVLTYREAKRLLDELRAGRLRALESRNHNQRNAAADEAVNRHSTAKEHRHMGMVASGELLAFDHAICALLDAAPALFAYSATLPKLEDESRALPHRVRDADVMGTPRPREFVWGAPSVNGFRPSHVSDQESIEMHGVIPEARGVHPAYDSAGHEVADRVGLVIERMINQHRSATFVVVSVDLYSTEHISTHPAWRAAYPARFNMPQAGERLSIGAEIDCPWCGAGNLVPHQTDAPALYAGESIDRACGDCRQPFNLRFRREQTRLIASPK